MHENVILHENETVSGIHFHMNGLTQGLILTQIKENLKMACYKTVIADRTQVYLKICEASTAFY